MKVINARFKSHCQTCYFTIFKNERIGFNGKAYHLDCIKALRDTYPRSMDKNKERLYGSIKRTKWADSLKMNGYNPLKVVESAKALSDSASRIKPRENKSG